MTRFVWLVAVPLVLGAGPALAQAGFYLPTSTTSYGQDEFRAADGTSCRSTMDGARHVEVGAFNSNGAGDGGYYASQTYATKSGKGNTGVYGRLSISLDAPTKRMDCNALYRLEIERRTLENEIMKRSLGAADSRLDALKNAPAEPEPATTASLPEPKKRKPKPKPKPFNVADELRRLPPP